MITVYGNLDAPNTTSSSLKGYIDATYDQLVGVLGEPTVNEPSGDEKTQLEWVVEFRGDIFTIYDWKTYNRAYTINELDRFNIGGTSYVGDFIDYLEQTINN